MKYIYPKSYSNLLTIDIQTIEIIALIAGIVIAGTALFGLFSDLKQYAQLDTGLTTEIFITQ